MNSYTRLIAFLCILTLSSVVSAEQAKLSRFNTWSPYPYVVGGTRSWPILTMPLGQTDTLRLSLDGKTLTKIANTQGIDISFTSSGKFQAKAKRRTKPLHIYIHLQRDGKTVQRQKIQLLPAPPARPICYVSDLSSELIYLFWYPTKKFVPVTKGGFDQYFRRLQAHGLHRLILWQSPFPFSVDSKFLSPKAWKLYKAQASAVANSNLLAKAVADPKLEAWEWVSATMRMRLTPDFGRMLYAAAKDHGIRLSAEFRPFEPALTKYYEIPAFTHRGRWLWGFLPLAWPTVNNSPEKVCFANYRTILRKMGQAKKAELSSIEFTKVLNAERFRSLKLRIQASHSPPIAPQSLVLVRGKGGDFELQEYKTIRQHVRKQRVDLSGFKVRVMKDRIRIENLKMPAGFRYLIVTSAKRGDEMIAAPLGHPVLIRSEAGNRLGRVNHYRVPRSGPNAESTRLAGISKKGSYRTTFQTIENNVDKLRLNATKEQLQDCDMVFDFGSNWSVEMLDFQRAATRAMALTQIKMMMSNSAFDEIFINTRSHTQLGASTADQYYGKGPIEPIENYRLKRRPYSHLGIDLAFAPISLAKNPRIRKLAASAKTASQLTDWQDDEWQHQCQSKSSPFVWRYERNLAVAKGMRLLLQDLEAAYPKTRIRVVLPPSERVAKATRDGLVTMKSPKTGRTYGSRYYQHMWGTLNYIPKIGEGMAMVDLRGLRVEPVFLGIRFLPDQGPLQMYLKHWFADMKGNRGSSFRGPRSFFYEAQETLRGTPKQRKERQARREEIIRTLLSHRKDIKEVLLYEAQNWVYDLPLNDPHKYTTLR